MAANRALGRAPHKTAGGLLLTAGVTIVMGIITAEALYTNPYNARMEISDLGATDTGVILHPSSYIFNATMLITGAMILIGAWFTHRALHRRAVAIPAGLLGVGVLGVGIFPGNIHPWHPIFAYTAFLAGGLAVLLSYKVTPQPLRAVFAILGAISLLFTIGGVLLPEWGPFGQLELGGVERWMVYPVVLWLVGFGGFLSVSRPQEPRRLVGPRFKQITEQANRTSASMGFSSRNPSEGCRFESCQAPTHPAPRHLARSWPLTGRIAVPSRQHLESPHG